MSFEHFQEGPNPTTRVLYGSPPEAAPAPEPKKDKFIGLLGLGLALIAVTMIFREDMGSPDIVPNDWR